LSARAQALQLLPHAMMPTRPNAALAAGLDHPRWLHVLPNGDVLVAETNAPERPLREELLGLQGKVMAFVMKRAGAAVPSANRITLRRRSCRNAQRLPRQAELAVRHGLGGRSLLRPTPTR
jgi:glucose/arabinose dehydrogenase